MKKGPVLASGRPSFLWSMRAKMAKTSRAVIITSEANQRTCDTCAKCSVAVPTIAGSGAYVVYAIALSWLPAAPRTSLSAASQAASRPPKETWMLAVATRAPNVWASAYGTTLFHSKSPKAAWARVTAGLMRPPETALAAFTPSRTPMAHIRDTNA